MKIVNRKTFLNMPPNTIFAKYEPCIFDELCIKGETIYDDFYFQSVMNVESDNSGEFIEILEDATKNGNSFRLDLHCEGRDCFFKTNQLFAVFEKQDVTMLIKRLNDCLSEVAEKKDEKAG